MDKILGALGGAHVSKERLDDDFSDRLSYRFTSALLICAAIIVSTKQYVGDPIQCWVPAHFTANHEEYANDYCWIKNTYYLANEKNVPKEHERSGRDVISYYQWIPLIMLFQALLYYLPIVLWRSLNKRSGMDVNQIVSSGLQVSDAEHAVDRDKALTQMALQLDRYLSSQRSIRTVCTLSMKHLFSRTCCFGCGSRKGNYLVSLYIFLKVVIIVNAVGQLFLLDAFLGKDFHLYGFEVIDAAIKGSGWTNRFPRVTMCDFKVRRLGNVQRYTVQCVLPINLFNEMIYLFVYFWMIFVAGVAVFSLAAWTLRFAFRVNRHRYVKKHLRLMGKVTRDEDKKYALKFVEDYLKQDGVFLLRLLGHNTDAITATEFVCRVWEMYRRKQSSGRLTPPPKAGVDDELA